MAVNTCMLQKAEECCFKGVIFLQNSVLIIKKKKIEGFVYFLEEPLCEKKDKCKKKTMVALYILLEYSVI